MQIQRVQGYFNGTGAAVYLCVGAIPKSVQLINVENATNSIQIDWKRSFATATAYGGLLMTGSTGVVTKLTTAGVFPYEGGDLLTAATQTSVAYGEGVYLGWDLRDYRADTTYGTGSTPINAWTMDTANNRTGHWNVAKVASGAKIGIGSIIRIKENSSGLVKEAVITALTSDGEAADEVTLSRNIGTGSITFIGGMYQLAPIAVGKVTPAGIYLNDTVVNVNDDTVAFEMDIEVP
jgi:hypothetical protein